MLESEQIKRKDTDMYDILTDERFAVARAHFERACKASRLHSTQARRALANYGDHGPDVSGCVRDHFPERVKSELRELAKLVTRETRAGHAARPPRVHLQTMIRLARAVASRDGSGFYGPQPFPQR